MRRAVAAWRRLCVRRWVLRHRRVGRGAAVVLCLVHHMIVPGHPRRQATPDVRHSSINSPRKPAGRVAGPDTSSLEEGAASGNRPQLAPPSGFLGQEFKGQEVAAIIIAGNLARVDV